MPLQHELTSELTAEQVRSMATPYPDFVALESIPSSLGYAAHERLEDIFGEPIASDDAHPQDSNEQTGQRAGFSLGSRVGREKEFAKNLPQITANVAAVAQERGVSEGQVWDEVQEIVIGSGIGQPMHRTLDHPLDGRYGVRDYIAKHADNGIAVIVRGNIANWQARRQDTAVNLLGSLPQSVLPNVRNIIYAGSSRQYGLAEAWRPEMQAYITDSPDEDGKQICTLTEASAATELYVPKMQKVLTDLELNNTEISTVSPGKAGGDEVMQAVAEQHGDDLKDMLVVEVGNAPAGYVQLAGGLILARELGIATEQFMTVSDGVEIVGKDYFDKLSPEQRSKVQNVATSLNSLNGWLQTIAKVNQYMLERSS